MRSTRRLFNDRRAAGRQLATAVFAQEHARESVVLALPRGGVPVAYEVALALGLRLDVLVVRKLGAPGSPELAIGAVGRGGTLVLNDDTIRCLAVSPAALQSVTEREREEVERRERMYRELVPTAPIGDRPVILIDDGAATGSTLSAAIETLRHESESPQRIVVALPVAPLEVRQKLECQADTVVCLRSPPELIAVSMWYRDFRQVSDGEVRRLLLDARRTFDSRRGEDDEGQPGPA